MAAKSSTEAAASEAKPSAAAATGGAAGAGAGEQVAIHPRGRDPPRVGSSGPVRMHVLIPSDDTGDVPSCDCGKQHLVYGRTYQFCTCGRAKKQPLCDGSSCEGTGYEPQPFVVDKKQTWYLMCACKRTQHKEGIMCDGRHSSLTMEDMSW